MISNIDLLILLLNIYMPFFNSSRRADCIAESVDAISMLDTIIDHHPNHMVVIGGDFNSVLKPIEIENGFGYNQKKCPALADLVKSAKLIDVFRHVYPLKQEFTFHQANCSTSRLDRFYISSKLISMV